MSVYNANNVIFDGTEQHLPAMGKLGLDSSSGLSPLAPSL